jgi:hypothetical protein
MSLRGESGGRCRLVLNQPDLFDEHVAPDVEELVESEGDLERRWRSRAQSARSRCTVPQGPYGTERLSLRGGATASAGEWQYANVWRLFPYVEEVEELIDHGARSGRSSSRTKSRCQS